MRTRWFSGRAILFHLALLVWFPGCLLAGWWQVTRALGGNDLSYLYSVEWPLFAVVGVWVWWVLVHTDPESVGARAQRRMAVTTPATPAQPTGPVVSERLAADAAHPSLQPSPDPEGDELAAYNDYLAQLASSGPGTWRRPTGGKQ